MELNREQIIKALECCSPSGKHCAECVYFYRAVDDICAPYLMADALALITSQEQRIKELTEECKKWQSRLNIECEYTKSDTVRKMQERVLQLFPEDKKFTTISRFTIDQIAKEMLDGKDEE